jgi:hypothetical protein
VRIPTPFFLIRETISLVRAELAGQLRSRAAAGVGTYELPEVLFQGRHS